MDLRVDGSWHDDALDLAIRLKNWRLSKIYASTFGRFPNAVRPVSFTEKMHARKLFDRRPEMGLFCDKLASRDYVRERAPELSLIPVLWSGEDVDAMPLETLKPPFVVKPSNGCMTVRFVRDASELDADAIRKECREWLDAPVHGGNLGEWGYGQVRRQIVIERMLLTETGEPPEDWKVFVFDGKARLIFLSNGRHRKGTRALLNRDGDAMPWEMWWRKGRYRFEGESRDPEEVAPIVRMAEHVGRDSDFVRVDLYIHAGKVWFGELSPYPFSGLNAPVLKGGPDSGPLPREADDLMGSFWKQPDWSVAYKVRTALLP